MAGMSKCRAGSRRVLRSHERSVSIRVRTYAPFQSNEMTEA